MKKTSFHKFRQAGFYCIDYHVVSNALDCYLEKLESEL